MNQTGVRALFSVQELINDVKECIRLLERVTTHAEAEIPALLVNIEQRIEADTKDAENITRQEAHDKVEELKSLVLEAREHLVLLRLDYPDSTPVRIDNGEFIV